jgi:tripartite-type tricarboxylate transporter receptor subunit TctC
MKFPRRHLLHLAASVAAFSAVSRVARAQTYPARPVHLIVGYGPGSGPDIIARLMGQWLSEQLGQPCIIENRPGAGSNIGTEAVVKAPPDGYTLLLVTLSNAINATLYDKLDFNFIRDITPIASISRVPGVMEINPSVPARTVPEFIAFAKANPGKINMASAGNGSPAHVYGELFKMMTGVDMVHVPYRSDPRRDLIGGQVQVMFEPITASIELIRAAKLYALAVTTPTRSEALPDIPTVGETVPGYEASGWFGIGAPKNTPIEIVERLNREIGAGLAQPKIKERLAELGNTVLRGSPADFGKLVADETEKWGKVVKFAGIKVE